MYEKYKVYIKRRPHLKAGLIWRPGQEWPERNKGPGLYLKKYHTCTLPPNVPLKSTNIPHLYIN